MRYFDESGNELHESEIDLTLGYLSEGIAIKVDAEPIDNETKWAWADEDYEVVQYYHLYADDPSYPDTPSPSDYEARIAALEEELEATKILLGVE